MNLEDRPDPALLRYARSSRNAEEVFGVFYQRHSGWVRRRAQARLNDADASDVTEEVFLCLWRRIFRLRSPYNVAGFLARVTGRKVCDCFRRNARWRFFESEELPFLPGMANGGLAGNTMPVPALSMELWELVEHSLEPREYAIFVQAVLYGRTSREISYNDGLTQGSVRRLLHQAKKKIRELENFPNTLPPLVR